MRIGGHNCVVTRYNYTLQNETKYQDNIMNILVTGANGQLGNEMHIIVQGSSDKYIFTDVNQVEGIETTYLDITDFETVRIMIRENSVNAIVNSAAWTNVDACENDENLAALAEKLNVEAPKNLAIAMKEVGGVLFHVSTDYVHTTSLVILIRRVLQQVFMVRLRSMGKIIFLAADAGISSFVRLGYIQSSAKTSARQCLTSQLQSLLST